MRSVPIKIVVFSRVDAKQNPGGIEAVVNELVPRMARLRPNWTLSAISAFRKIRSWNSIPLLGDLIAGFVLWWKARGADVVIVHGAEYLLPLALGAERKRTIVVWHGTRAAEVPALVPKMDIRVRLYWWLEQRLQSLAFRIPFHVVVAPSVIDELRTAYGRAPNAVVIVNGAPATPAFERPLSRNGDRNVVVWVGTNAYKKGLDIAIAAAREARRDIANLELQVFGMNAPVADDPWIHWMGKAPRERVLEAVATADAVLATTRYEACSMAVLEALSLRATVIGSPVIAWMLDGAGIGVADYDASSYAAALRSLFNGSVRPEPGSIESVARRFDWDVAATGYVALVESVLTNTRT